jgi:poly-gamma-glutamate capsule biosynthesis protein CapA/YwtB (metallophosphatase superfamily)
VRPSRTIHLVACALLLAVASCSEPERAAGPPVRETTPTVSPTTPAGREGPGPRPLHEPLTTLTVVGDIMLGRRVGERAAAEGDPSYPLRPMQRRLRSADITVGNLESTLSTEGSPTQGGDSFAADPEVARGLRTAGFDALSVANNHAGDYGETALVQTVDRLAAAGLRPFGAGRNLAGARRPAVVERHGVRFGFVGFNAIGETPEAGPSQPGASSVSMPIRTGPLDRAELDRLLEDVRLLAGRVDVVTVMPHWGDQYTERPLPIQEYVARRLVRAGADLVVGGHPHWVQGASLADDSLVVQSLGNFTFDMTTPETNEGLVLEATYWGDELKGVDFVPYRIGADHAPRVVPYDAAERMFASFWRFSELGATSPR